MIPRARTRPRARHPRPGLPADWRPWPVALIRTASSPEGPRCRIEVSPPPTGAMTSPAAGQPQGSPGSPPITLEQILSTFHALEDPRSRVFGGYQQASPAAEADLSTRPVWTPLISGVAEPGSKIGVAFSDETGMVINRTEVFSDASGFWFALGESQSSSLLPPHQVSLAMTPPTWSHSVEPVHYRVAFPSPELIPPPLDPGMTASGLIGSVLPSQPAPPDDSSPSW